MISLNLLQNYSALIVVGISAVIFGAIVTEVLSKTENDSSGPSDYLFVGLIALLALVGIAVLGSRM